jgi:hypothetical protein
VQNRQNLDRGLISQKSRDLFAGFSNNPNNELFFQRLIPCTGSTPGGPGPVGRGTVDPRWRGQRARWRAHRSLAPGRSGARKLTGGGATERGKRGELGSGLTGRRRCRTGRRRHSVRGLLRRGEREIGAGRGAVKLGEGARLWQLTPALMALTPLKMGRLDERLRSAIKEGNQGAG